MKYFKKYVGKKIYLSPINHSDYEIFCTWLNSMETSVYLGFTSTNLDIKKEQEALINLAKGHTYSIVTLADNQLIGNCSLAEIDTINRTATLGIFIGNTSGRNNGYGTEAIELLLSCGFKILNLNNIMLKVFEFNKPALAVYKKVGFKEFGRRTKAYFINDKYYDTIYMEILKEDFSSKVLDEAFNNIIQ